MFSGAAPAKAILMGEHFVVHGAPALAVPVKSLSLRVTLVETLAQEPVEGHLGVCLRTCRDALDRGCDLPLGVQVRSSIPEGAGLGSSAALSIAMARAVAEAFRAPLTDETLRALSMACERAAHGRPSGIDTEVCLTGRPIWIEPGQGFRAETGPRMRDVGLVVLDTGPGAATAGMIRRVAEFRERRSARFDELIAETRERTARARDALACGDAAGLGELLTRQHEALREIGVSTAGLDRAVEEALRAGAAGAKLSGAGGGGVAVVVAPAEALQDLSQRLRRAGQRVLAAGPVSR